MKHFVGPILKIIPLFILIQNILPSPQTHEFPTEWKFQFLNSSNSYMLPLPQHSL